MKEMREKGSETRQHCLFRGSPVAKGRGSTAPEITGNRGHPNCDPPRPMASSMVLEVA